MGCLPSKLGNEDPVRRCKGRRRQVKEAIDARNHLAAAHSRYLLSLKKTGLALSNFAAGEPISVSDCSTASVTSNEDEMEHDNDDYNETKYYDPTSELESVSSSGPLPSPSVKIKNYFDKAAEAGARVSEILAQLDPSSGEEFSKMLAQLITSSGEQASEMLAQLDLPSNVHVSEMLDQLDTSGDQVSEMPAQHDSSGGEEVSEMLALHDPSGLKICLVLDVLLALEEKLYPEVKERGVFKNKRAELSAALQSQEHKGKDESKLKKTMASIQKLDSQILATSTAVSAFSNAIVKAQAKLGPQLVELCRGFVFMWKFMDECHEVQNQVIQSVRGLVNRSTASTSDLRRQATRDLEAALSDWHTSFCLLIKFQRDFIKSLRGWLRLTLPIDMDEAARPQTSDVCVVLATWNRALEQSSYTTTSEAASKAIENFMKDVQLLSSKQVQEMEVKKSTELASKELKKKASSLKSSIEKKYCHSNSMVRSGLLDGAQDDGHDLYACQRRIEEETRAMTLDIPQGLSGVFEAMKKFSLSIWELLKDV